MRLLKPRRPASPAPLLCGLLLAALVLGLRPNRADAMDLVLGADYWFHRDGRGLFSLMLNPQAHLARRLSVGGRFGALIATDPTQVGIPLDLQLRLNFRGAYAEALAGPWIMFVDDPVRAHVAFGFGLRGGGLSLGLELGWLDPDTVIGLRLAFPL